MTEFLRWKHIHRTPHREAPFRKSAPGADWQRSPPPALRWNRAHRLADDAANTHVTPLSPKLLRRIRYCLRALGGSVRSAASREHDNAKADWSLLEPALWGSPLPISCSSGRAACASPSSRRKHAKVCTNGPQLGRPALGDLLQARLAQGQKLPRRQTRAGGICREEGIPHEICGKVIVATCPEELPALERIFDRGRRTESRVE